MPGSAVGRTTLKITRQRGAPSASADWAQRAGDEQQDHLGRADDHGKISSESAIEPL